MSMRIFQYTDEQRIGLLNQAKEQIIFALAHEGLLKGDPEDISRHYVIVLYARGLFGRIWDRFRGIEKSDDGLSYFAVMKAVNYPMEDDERKGSHLKVVPIKKD